MDGDDIDKNPVQGKAILSVTAVNQVNELTPFSNFGLKSVDIAAPGSNILAPTVSRKTKVLELLNLNQIIGSLVMVLEICQITVGDILLIYSVTPGPDSYKKWRSLDYSPFTDTYMTSPMIDLSIYNARRG